ncbi:hypothetical protein [Nocardiopsis chromatogenes]|uniref:hypothetical protein n=1 Tax=Nocardiopsis chromatogenes TaxID=280239 RepID=UPI001268499B|nr:hypothetical protein [Nocardiopsis chromatogenes]
MDDPQLTRGYEGREAHPHSKWSLVAHTFAVADAFARDGNRVTRIHPVAFMEATMVPEAGASPLNSVDTGVTGRFSNEEQESPAHPEAYDPDSREGRPAPTERPIAPVAGSGGGTARDGIRSRRPTLGPRPRSPPDVFRYAPQTGSVHGSEPSPLSGCRRIT